MNTMLFGFERSREGLSFVFVFLNFETRERLWLNEYLTAEAVEGSALALERVDDVHGGDRLASSVLGVRHRIADDVLEEHLEDASGLFVDETGDALDTTTASQAADRRLGDALNVVTEHLAVALGAALSETLTTLTTARHCCRSTCRFVTHAHARAPRTARAG